MPGRMRYYKLTRVVASLLAVTLGLLAVLTYVDYYGFTGHDLRRYEDTTYGVEMPDVYEEWPVLLTWSKGDGQAFMTVAADLQAVGPVLGLGRSNYRYSRAGYSAAAWLLSLGTTSLLPIGLLLTNLICLAALGWFAASRASSWGPRAYALVLIPGALIATAGSTAEALGLLLAVLGIAASSGLGRTSAALLGIVRPDFATVLLLKGKEGFWRVVLCGLSAITIRVVGMARGLGGSSGFDNFALPGTGYVAVIPEQLLPIAIVTTLVAAAGLIALLQGVFVERGFSRLAFIGTGLFVLMLGPAVLAEPVNSLRATTAVPLLWIVGRDIRNRGRAGSASPSSLND